MKRLRLYLVAVATVAFTVSAMAQTTVTFGNNYVIPEGEEPEPFGVTVPGEIAFNDGTYDEENLHADGYPPSTGYPAEEQTYTSGALTLVTYYPRPYQAGDRDIYVSGEYIPVFQINQVTDEEIAVFGKGSAILTVDESKEIESITVNGSRNGTTNTGNVAAAFCDQTIFDVTKVTGVDAVTLPSRQAPANAVTIAVPAGTKSILLAAKLFYTEPAEGGKYNTIVASGTEGAKNKGGNTRTYVAYLSVTYKDAGSSSISIDTVEKAIVNVSYYDVLGASATASAKGVLIQATTYEDGSVTYSKIYR